MRPSDRRARDRSAALAVLESRVARHLGLAPTQVRIEADGPGDEIAVVRVPAAALGALLAAGVRTEIVERAHAAGFRHAALDLELAGEAPAHPEA